MTQKISVNSKESLHYIKNIVKSDHTVLYSRLARLSLVNSKEMGLKDVQRTKIVKCSLMCKTNFIILQYAMFDCIIYSILCLGVLIFIGDH